MTTRQPMDGVLCVLWFGNDSLLPRQAFGQWSNGHWVVWDADPGRTVTHWTTIAECFAAPAMREALVLLLEMSSACTADAEIIENNRRRDIARQALAQCEKEGKE